MRLAPRGLVALALLAAATVARAETLDELVKREEGVAFGACALTPKPALPGEVHVVIPARFETPGIWVTRTILLIALDDAKAIGGTLALKVADGIPPRQVISVACKGNRMTVRITDRTLTYAFDGRALKKVPR
jgi:hypothetical protein